MEVHLEEVDAEEMEAIEMAMAQVESRSVASQPGCKAPRPTAVARDDAAAAAHLSLAQIERARRNREQALKRRQELEGSEAHSAAAGQRTDVNNSVNRSCTTSAAAERSEHVVVVLDSDGDQGTPGCDAERDARWADGRAKAVQQQQSASSSRLVAAGRGEDEGVIKHTRLQGHAQQAGAKRRGVYVLELNGGGFYVGKSEDIDTRIQQHKSGAHSSSWCCAQGGVKRELPTLCPPQDDLSSWEQKETIHQMLVHGFDRVRGFEWTKCGPLDRDDCTTIRTMIWGHGDLCRRCGGDGHFQSQCGNRPKLDWLRELDDRCQGTDHGKVLKKAALAYRVASGASSSSFAPTPSKRRLEPTTGGYCAGGHAGGDQQGGAKRFRPTQVYRIPCTRCGRDSHAASSCFAKTGVDGARLSDGEEEEDEEEEDEDEDEDEDEEEDEDEDEDEEEDEEEEEDGVFVFPYLVVLLPSS